MSHSSKLASPRSSVLKTVHNLVIFFIWLFLRKPTLLAFEKVLQNVWEKYCIDSFISNQACSRKQRPYANAFSLYAAKFFFWSVCHWSNFELSTDDQHWNGCSRHHCFAQYRVMLFTFYSITIIFLIFSCTDKGALLLMTEGKGLINQCHL